jgi:dUTPase
MHIPDIPTLFWNFGKDQIKIEEWKEIYQALIISIKTVKCIPLSWIC